MPAEVIGRSRTHKTPRNSVRARGTRPVGLVTEGVEREVKYDPRKTDKPFASGDAEHVNQEEISAGRGASHGSASKVWPPKPMTM